MKLLRTIQREIQIQIQKFKFKLKKCKFQLKLLRTIQREIQKFENSRERERERERERQITTERGRRWPTTAENKAEEGRTI